MARAWLLLAAGESRRHVGNDGYDDVTDQYYSWDETVSNGRYVEVGDRVVVWNARAGAIGASVVEAIEVSTGPKRLSRCPDCGRAGLKERRTLQPRYRCQNCKAVFDEPVSRIETVQTYRSRHDAAWVALDGKLSASELRGLAMSPESLLSIRPLDWERFASHLGENAATSELSDIDGRGKIHPEGHVRVLTRARLGQTDFRARLVDEFGFVCAITGEQPPEVLDAAHLYSYAEVGTHHEHGGLLLRRDVHALFDRGLLMVDPVSARVRLARAVASFSDYRAMVDMRIQVELHAQHREWLGRHWAQHSRRLAG